MKVERIRRVSQATKIEDRDLTDKKFGENLGERGNKFQKKLKQKANNQDNATFDKKRAQVEVDIARMAMNMRIKHLEDEEQEK